MHKTTTLPNFWLKGFFGKMLALFILLASFSKIAAQPYNNGNMSTGATSSNNTPAPAGFTWSEIQPGILNFGYNANITNFTVADNFIVPAGQGWAITKMTFYGYSTGFAGTTSPFNDVRVQIFNTDPSIGTPTPIFGNLTTNRFLASSTASMYRINATPATNRQIWAVESTVTITLGPGNYWIEWGLGNGGLSNFLPGKTVVGTVTQPGNNAKQHATGGAWTTLAAAEGGNAQDMPFRIDYTVTTPPACIPITGSVISAPSVIFNEGFDAVVPPAGWFAQNNSTPVGATNWTQGGPLGVFPPHSGAGFISANFNNTGSTGTISNWLVVPNTPPTLRNGDVFKFWTRTTTGAFPDRLQVRMNTSNNGTNVGTGATGLGDFTTLLLDINPSYTSTGYPTSWTEFTITLSGLPSAGTSGRLAFRYFVENAGLFGANSDFIGIDDASYTSSATPTVCVGGTGNIVVNITGGVGPYTVTYNAAPGGNTTVNNYVSGANIPVSLTANTTYTLVSVVGFDGCVGTNNTGSATINTVTGSTAAVLSQVGGAPIPSVTFSQGFDVVSPLPAGWAAQNLSNPIGLQPGWFQGNAAVFPSQNGAANSYIAANFQLTSGTNTISNWLFAPNVTLKNGDIFTFYTRTTTGTFPDRLQVRMSTNGASVNAGTSNTSVGDFSTLLLDINPTYTTTGYPTSWTQFTITLSGLPAAGISGRLAFRYFVENGGPSGANSDYIGIDNVVYTTSNPGPPPLTCIGSTPNLKVDITGGTSPYTVVINRAPGGPFTVTNYVSGANIPVTPVVNTTYTLVSVTSAEGCVGTGNSGVVTITITPLAAPVISVTANPDAPLCAGDPTLLTVVGGGGTATFTSAAPVVINASGIANPYPSPLVVSGLPAGATVRSVSLNGISHTFGDDVDILLQGPTTTQNVVLISDCNGGNDWVNHTFVLQDGAPAMADATLNASGTYRPTNFTVPDTWVAPGPGSINQPAPVLTTFTGNLNGTWNLFIVDDLGGDAGSLTSYTITFNLPPAPLPNNYTYLWTPAAGLSSTTTNPVAASPMVTTTYTVTVTDPVTNCPGSATKTVVIWQRPAVTSHPANTTACAGTSVSFNATGTGQGATYQWQVSTDGGVNYTNLANTPPYSGVTTQTLTINPVTVAMNNNRYRLVVSGTCAPAANSTGAILTVNALPVVTISPAGQQCGGIAGTNGTALTASGATSYVWAPLTGLFTNATATTAYTGTNLATVYAAPTVNTVYTVTGTSSATGCSNTASVTVVYTPAAPIVVPASASVCLGGTAQQLTIQAATPITQTFSSGPISVAVPDNNVSGANHVLSVPIPATAVITDMTVAINMTHTWDGDMVFVLKAPNNAILNLVYFLSGTGGTAATTGFTNTRISSSGTNAISTGSNPYNAIFRADAQLAAGAFGPAGPTGFVPTVTTWPALWSVPNGNYTLAMWDGGPADLGVLTSWSITVTYTAGNPPPVNGIWTPIAGLFSNAAATIPYVAGTPAQTVWALPTTSTTYSVTVSSAGPDALQTFTNPAPIIIPSVGTGTPYPSNINVTGLPTTGVSVRSVTLTGINHTWGNDVDILLQSPTGQNVILMSDIGGTVAIPNATYTFDDAGGALSTGAANPTGTYRPTNVDITDNWPAPGPGAFAQAAPALGLFGNTANVNGAWKLFVVDDTGGDQGSINGGFSITFSSPTPGCNSPARLVPITVNTPVAITGQPANASVCTNNTTTFSVTVTGTTPTFQWQVSTDNGNTWTNITNGGVYSGATTSTLSITAPPVSMNGYMYRVIVNGTAPCGSVTSFQRVLTVNPLPTVTIAASPYTRLMPGLSTTLTSTVSPFAAATYTWLRDGIPVPGGTTASLSVNVDGLGAYSLRVTDINGCTNTSNTISILDSASGKCFIYPNPNTGQFQVRYYSVSNNVGLPRTLTVYDSKGERVFSKNYSIGRPYDRMDVDLRRNGKGLYWVEVGDVNGNRLTMCRVVIQ